MISKRNSLVLWHLFGFNSRRYEMLTGLRPQNRSWSCRSGVVLRNKVLSRSSS